MQVHPTYMEDEDIVQTTNSPIVWQLRLPSLINGYWQGNL